MRHPRDKWGPQEGLARLIFFTVRMALHEPRHPDHKRQRSTRGRDLTFHAARQLKLTLNQLALDK